MVGATLLAWGVFQVIMDLRVAKQRRVVDRLTESRARGREKQVKESLLRKRASELQEGVLDGLVSRLQVVTKLQRTLDQADVDWSASRLLVNLTAMSLLVGATLLFLQFSPVSALAAAVGVLALPLLYLVRKRKKRIRVLVEQLPDVFDLMSQALRAGHALAGSIQLVSEQLPDPIAKEFARVFHEQNLGIKVEEALLNMANRVDQMDVRLIVRMGAAGAAGRGVCRLFCGQPRIRARPDRDSHGTHDARNRHRDGSYGYGYDQEDRQYQGVKR